MIPVLSCNMHYLITNQIITQKENSILPCKICVFVHEGRFEDKIWNVKLNDLKWTNHIDVSDKRGVVHSKSNCLETAAALPVTRDSRFVCVLRSMHNLLFILTLSLKKKKQLYSLHLK